MYTLSMTFRTKSEAKDAVKRGDILHVVRNDGMILTSANGGPFPIRGKLDHYKEWAGTCRVVDGRVMSIT